MFGMNIHFHTSYFDVNYKGLTHTQVKSCMFNSDQQYPRCTSKKSMNFTHVHFHGPLTREHEKYIIYLYL